MSIKLNKERADVFVPDSLDIELDLSKTTHLAIGAHQDDLEIMAYNGIVECFEKDNKWFTGVVVTNGSGSSRTGEFAKYTDEEMQGIRKDEQCKAAEIGKYLAQFQLNYPSSEVKDAANSDVVNDIYEILKVAKPEVVYLHNPADKHDTHVATMLRALAAIYKLPQEDRPIAVYGCEVWRNLDWLDDSQKVVLKCDKNPELASAILDVFASQIAGGKRYDLATIGRRLSNATFFESHAVDSCNSITFALDLAPFIEDENLTIEDYVSSKIDSFKEDVINKLNKYSN